MLVFLQTPERYQHGGTCRAHLDSHKMFKCILYLRQTLMGLYTDGHEGVLDEAGGEQHSIIEAAPHELKLGEGG